MSKGEEPAQKKMKVECDDDVMPGTSESSEETEEGMDMSVENGKRMEELAGKLWARDAKKAGLEGMSVEQAVIASMSAPIMSLLPDPLQHPPGTQLDPDSWLVHGAAAGLLEDEDCMLLSVRKHCFIFHKLSKECRKNTRTK